jgi:hypothetical protein
MRQHQRGRLRPLPRAARAGRDRRLHLDQTPAAASGQQRRHPRAEPGRIYLLDPHDPDIAALELGHQRIEVGARGLQGGEIEHHRLAGEKAGGALEPAVELHQPVPERSLRLQDEGEQRSATEPHGFTGANGVLHGWASSSLTTPIWPRYG